MELDDIRIGLASALFAEGRREAPDWLGPWETAVSEAVARTLAWIAGQARTAQELSRAPERVARRVVPDEDEVRVIQARLESAGIPLEEAVAHAGYGQDPALRASRIGGAIEESWLDLEAAVLAVTTEYQPRIAAVRGWRRPTSLLWVATAAAGLAAMLAGLMIGGYLPAPSWAAPVVAWWWRLPWP